MWNRLAQRPFVVVESQEDWPSSRSLLGGGRVPSSIPGFSIPGFQCWEEESLQNLSVKISRDSDHQGKRGDC